MTRSRRAAAVVLAVVVYLGGLGGSYWLGVHNAVTVAELCQAGNQARAQQITLWEHLVVISRPPPHETVQARNARVRTTRAFLAFVHHVFAPRSCAQPNRAQPTRKDTP